jgi:hypothetical protein
MRLKLAAAVALLFAAQTGLSQTQFAQPSSKNKFTSPDAAFRFAYPDPLVSCKRDSDQLNRWTPDESCEAVTPVCSDVSGNSDDTAA